MKNFTDQMADINEQNIKLRKELELANDESDRKNKTIWKLRLEVCELKSNKNNER